MHQQFLQDEGGDSREESPHFQNILLARLFSNESCILFQVTVVTNEMHYFPKSNMAQSSIEIRVTAFLELLEHFT